MDPTTIMRIVAAVLFAVVLVVLVARMKKQRRD